MVMWIWLVGLGLAILSALIYWAFVVTEGAYLGSQVVAWTYDLTAQRYDQIKQFRPQDDEWLLAGPMLRELRQVNAPLILDVATGTGRMPLALLSHPLFRGYVVGLDLSLKMLERAQEKLGEHIGRYSLVWGNAQNLVCADESFDAVCCLEALEFMPAPRGVLQEMCRVLRPGGVLLTTNRINWEGKLMPGKAFTDKEIGDTLGEIGLTDVDIRPWQVYYDLIWARKAGSPSGLRRGTREVASILRCPSCQHSPLTWERERYRCLDCGETLPLEDNIIRTTC